MSIIGSNILAGASGQAGYNLNNSLRFRSSASGYLSRTLTTPTNNKIWTWSGWVKLGKLSTFSGLFGALNGTDRMYIAYGSSAKWQIYGTNAGTDYVEAFSTGLYRDPSAWYHLVIAVDTTQATASNRLKMYVNGTQETISFTTNMTLNANTSINKAIATVIGESSVGNDPFDGYMTEVNFVDGSQLTPSSFGETSLTTGQWIPKKYTSTYGTNGFYLKFADASAATAAAIGKDSSGNGNNWTPSGISVTAGVTYDAMLDVPTNTSATVANYCTWNPLNFRISAATTFSNANLTSTFAGGGYATAYGTIAVTSGKYYWEVTVDTVGGDSQIGISEAVSIDSTSAVYRVYRSSGQKQTTGNVSSAYGSSYTTSDIIGVALDIDSGTITFYKNNTSQGTAFTDIASALPSTGWTPYGYGYSGNVLSANFGQRPFSYTAPSGYVALNTYNLPTPTILQGNKYMDATLYTGNSGVQTVVNNAQFKPDFVWMKDRSNARNHVLSDSVRGTASQLESNTTAAQTAYPNSLTAFNSNGFTLGDDTRLNNSAETYVGWQWQAGQGTTSSNTSGSITSTVSVSTTAGFSVVTYTGTLAAATIGHGLGVAPQMIITKNRAQAGYNWRVYHVSIGAANYMSLNLTNASAAASSVWNSTTPTSTVFSVAADGGSNNTDTMVAYCFTAVKGYSAFGSYTGNGSADGPMIFLGFRPKFIITKITTSADEWITLDSARSDVANANTNDQVLNPYSSAAESSGSAYGNPLAVDFLSNGFKIRGTQNANNNSGSTFIYMAFAANPFKNSTAF